RNNDMIEQPCGTADEIVMAVRDRIERSRIEHAALAHSQDTGWKGSDMVSIPGCETVRHLPGALLAQELPAGRKRRAVLAGGMLKVDARARRQPAAALQRSARR